MYTDVYIYVLYMYAYMALLESSCLAPGPRVEGGQMLGLMASYPDSGADPRKSSTLGFYQLQCGSISTPNSGVPLVGSCRGSGY